MFAEIGHFSLVLALLMSLLLSVYPMWGAYKNQPQLMALAKPLAIGMFLFTAIAFAALVNAFYNDDFSVAYVANHSNSLLPWYYKITAVWGGHEGSFLLWILIFSMWTVAVAVLSNSIPQAMVARVLSILGMVAVGFYLFVIIASNPFESLLPFYPVDGRDLNPLLQDFGMIIHPPTLYMGYVGFAVAFAFAISALISGQLDSTWARWSRPWTLAAWCFLTVGIALGSWWAYYELGWGGWWFWDPVENASFMPWLVGTALVHSLAVTEKRKIFKSWTVLLAISAFSLSLLGTFLVRSGVLVSVHSFASDPTRGLFILAILGVVIGSSLTLYAIRAPHLKSVGRYEWFSREVMLMGNNLLLTAATLVVLLGTLLPLVHKEIGLGSISIGAPFFNEMFVYLIVPFVLLLAMGPLSRWKKQSAKAIQKQLISGFALSVCAALLVQASYSQMTYMATLGMILSVWVLIATVQEIMQRIADKSQSSTMLERLAKLTPSHWGMVLGHVGFAVMLIGITLVSNYEQEKDVRMRAGDVIEIGGYAFQFSGVRDLSGPNYDGHVGIVDVYTDSTLSEKVTHLEAEKRFYPVQRTSMTEAGIDSGITRDLFVALGEQLNDGAWAIRIYIKPFVNWIWAGALFMALGGIMSISDKRYRMAKVAKAKQLKNAEADKPLANHVVASKTQG
ncbi:heme lyase CcmF/NrfE family subunit [Aliiglaciecola lipolytica]|uniref:Cytochrome c-type biogenesis protein CcmF n=1 Tax=Aliiglaciecola lipolytica E3 TaxID=1127673 RepID=K6XVQ4_9ALTE|nr:heme lyase CcmF/NrfE family subunit [Aliiglaciecola lipolytica]GAC15741.1 cytochrome c-type biogenesis protein CcmF [Aliiglaciecola lipolytica E3]